MWWPLLALWIVAQLVAAPLIGRRLARLRKAQSRTVLAARGDAGREVPIQFAIVRPFEFVDHGAMMARPSRPRPAHDVPRAERFVPGSAR